jgi:hypothetical protein
LKEAGDARTDAPTRPRTLDTGKAGQRLDTARAISRPKRGNPKTSSGTRRFANPPNGNLFVECKHTPGSNFEPKSSLFFATSHFPLCHMTFLMFCKKFSGW